MAFINEKFQQMKFKCLFPYQLDFTPSHFQDELKRFSWSISVRPNKIKKNAALVKHVIGQLRYELWKNFNVRHFTSETKPCMKFVNSYGRALHPSWELVRCYALVNHRDDDYVDIIFDGEFDKVIFYPTKNFLVQIKVVC